MLFFRKKATKNLQIPQHVAIIMDGNSRWAKSKKIPLKLGHKAGSENLINITKSSAEIGIKFLTVYAFSSENWNRPKQEVEDLMNLLEDYLEEKSEFLIKNQARLLISGNTNKLRDSIKKKISNLQEATKDNAKITLNIALSYGSRQEIVDAIKKIAIDIAKNKIKAEDIDEKIVQQNLYHPNLPDPDLLIRTAGDLRLSNFLLWQSAYTELYFSKLYWPDFNKKHLLEAIINFNQRERKYGKRQN